MTDRQLINLAEQASRNAYVPYSHFAVGAALECRDGTVFTGCNVENAALGSKKNAHGRKTVRTFDTDL